MNNSHAEERNDHFYQLRSSPAVAWAMPGDDVDESLELEVPS